MLSKYGENIKFIITYHHRWGVWQLLSNKFRISHINHQNVYIFEPTAYVGIRRCNTSVVIYDSGINAKLLNEKCSWSWKERCELYFKLIYIWLYIYVYEQVFIQIVINWHLQKQWNIVALNGNLNSIKSEWLWLIAFITMDLISKTFGYFY